LRWVFFKRQDTAWQLHRNPPAAEFEQSVFRAGYAVCIWPKHIEQKDINDMWLNGYRNVEDIIKENTHSGLNAELRLAAWKRC